MVHLHFIGKPLSFCQLGLDHFHTESAQSWNIRKCVFWQLPRNCVWEVETKDLNIDQKREENKDLTDIWWALHSAGLPKRPSPIDLPLYTGPLG